MLTTNQVPFIAQVSVISYSWAMKVPSICCAKYLLYNINLDKTFNKQSIKSEQDNKYKTC